MCCICLTGNCCRLCPNRRCDVVEFVSTEHTPRNLLIRAVKKPKVLSAGEAAEIAQQYKQLRDAWKVQPQLEKLLVGSFAPEVVQVLAN